MFITLVYKKGFYPKKPKMTPFFLSLCGNNTHLVVLSFTLANARCVGLRYIFS